MRVTDHHGKKPLQLLLDSGSTHNFIDASKAMKLDCMVENSNPMWVKVADGAQIQCKGLIQDFTWRMQGVEFKADVLLLPLSGSDLVLRVHWFTQLGPVLWDFSNLTHQYTSRGKKVKLREISGKKVKPILSMKLDKMLQAPRELSMLQLISSSTRTGPHPTTIEGASPSGTLEEILEDDRSALPAAGE
ncbi:hypothetical protein BVRB_2g039170 [Beta vulgaris subsp. vulgaris]|nr:hypothetical protein BVRB_2g039170 [Beta vulgaris subsp. vulgaris]